MSNSVSVTAQYVVDRFVLDDILGDILEHLLGRPYTPEEFEQAGFDAEWVRKTVQAFENLRRMD